MPVTGAISPKQYDNAITRNEQKKKYYPMQHQSEINKNKPKIDFFVVSNIASIVSSPSKKADKNEVHAIKDLLQWSISSAYRC